MAVIEKTVELIGSKTREKVVALFDSGASYSCVQPQIAERLGAIVPLGETLEVETAEKGRIIKVTEVIELIFRFDGYRFSDEFMVIPDLSETAIIGTKTMQAWRMKLDFENDEVIIDPRVTRLRLL